MTVNGIQFNMNRSLETLGVFQFTQAHPLPSPQTIMDACIQNFFRISVLYTVGGGRTVRKFWKGCTVLWGNPEWQNMNITKSHNGSWCYITVPRTFVHDCRWGLLSNGVLKAAVYGTVTPRSMDTRIIRTPHYYGQFALSLGKESPYIFSTFNPLSILISGVWIMGSSLLMLPSELSMT